MGIFARLLGNTNTSSDVNLLDGKVPTKDQFVIDEPITDSVLNQSPLLSRMDAYEKIVALSEISHYDEYDFIVVNDEIELAFNNVKSILYSERLRGFRQIESKLNLD